MDFFHFRGNEIPYMTSEHYEKGFFGLPYYDFSESDQYLKLRWEHQFNGFIMDKLPLLKKTNYSFVFTTNQLWTEQQGWYSEYALGIDRLGFGIFRLIRLDVAWTKAPSNSWNTLFRFGVKI